MIKISPSIGSCDLMNVENELRKTKGADNLHIDIEDGNFVPNITFGIKFLRQLRKITDIPFSVHLMCENPLDYFDDLKELSCSHIFIHVEKQVYLRRILNKYKRLNCSVGIALNPISKIMDYEYCFDLIDSILYLTSEPDFAGELIINSALEKVRKIDNKEICIDGGITNEILKQLDPTQIDYVVMGREFFRETTNRQV